MASSFHNSNTLTLPSPVKGEGRKSNGNHNSNTKLKTAFYTAWLQAATLHQLQLNA